MAVKRFDHPIEDSSQCDNRGPFMADWNIAMECIQCFQPDEQHQKSYQASLESACQVLYFVWSCWISLEYTTQQIFLDIIFV